MRAALSFVTVILAPLLASAEPYHAHRVDGSPFSDVVYAPPKRATTSGPRAFTQVSNVIFLNRCKGGCVVKPGDDDSRTNTSSIAQQQSVLTEWPYGDQQWGNLVQCVRDLYAPFNVKITDVDPGTANHFEVMVAGSAAALGQEGAGGVAPIEPCDGQLIDNVPSFVFAGDISDLDFLCWAAAQESSHVFGLDHQLNPKDPMTYLSPPRRKPGFQNQYSDCGEEAGQPRECWCGGTQQNSYQHLMDIFGPANLEPATLSITQPVEGAWVKPGFTVRAELVSQLSITTGSLQVDGSKTQSIEQGEPLVWNASQTLDGGQHTLELVATDTAERTLMSAPITINVVGRCVGSGDCTDGTHCLGGFCLPGANVTGGLGATCTTSEDCITEACGSDGEASRCTATCDAGGTCPSGYACLEAGAASVCWPDDSGGGGCTTSTNGNPLLALLGLGAFVMIVRRRR
jgi:uncharacterized protein (TIGR03382 family)